MSASRMNGKQRRRAILEAALRVIARTNYDRATTASIAREAGINEALIYHHFDSKRTLLLTLLDMIGEDMLGFLENAASDGEPSLSALRNAGRQYQLMAEKHPDRIKVLIKAAVVDDKEVRDKVWEIVKSFHGFIRGRLESAKSAGIIGDAADTEMAAWLLLSWANFISLTRILGKSREISDERIDLWVDGIASKMKSARAMRDEDKRKAAARRPVKAARKKTHARPSAPKH